MYNKPINKMKNKEILGHVAGLYNSIYNVECYSATDILLLETFKNVLHKRGYEIKENIKLSIKKCK